MNKKQRESKYKRIKKVKKSNNKKKKKKKAIKFLLEKQGAIQFIIYLIKKLFLFISLK